MAIQTQTLYASLSNVRVSSSQVHVKTFRIWFVYYYYIHQVFSVSISCCCNHTIPEFTVVTHNVWNVCQGEQTVNPILFTDYSDQLEITNIFQTIPSSEPVIGTVVLLLLLLIQLSAVVVVAPGLYESPSGLPLSLLLLLTLLFEEDDKGCSLGGMQSTHPMDATNQDMDANIAQ